MINVRSRQAIIGTIAVVLIAVVIVVGIVNTPKPATQTDQQTAYENVIKDSLNTYHARYEKYPDSYQTLLDDMDKSRDLYGVNDEGMSELTDITDRLTDFSYAATSHDAGYTFTYKKAGDGKTATIKNE